MSEFLIITLSVLVTGLNIFWAWLCLGLVNRLMSKDFNSYMAAEYKPTRLQPIKSDELTIDPESERQAQEINSLFGIA